MRYVKGAWHWIVDRLGLEKVSKVLLEHPVPPETTSARSGWMYVFGFAAMFILLLQIVTGVALATKYIPSTAHAYESLQQITNEVQLGRLLRGMHYFGASAMVVIVLVHMARVYLTGSFKFPREMNWVTGVVLLFLTLAMAYTGQLLRWNQDGVWSVVVASYFAGRVPLIGTPFAQFLLGGETVGGVTLSRFFAFHVFAIPALIFAFLGVHLFLVLHHGISEPPKKGRPVDPKTYRQWYEEMLEKRGKPYFPDAAWKEAVFTTVVIVVIAVLAFIFGPRDLGFPPDPTQLAADPRPDWYFTWYYALLAIKPQGLEDFFMVYLPILALLALLILPFVASRGERSPAKRPWAVAIVGVLVLTFSWLTLIGLQAPWVPAFGTEPLPEELVDTTQVAAHEGALIFHAKGCQFCHRVAGRGGEYGPDLTDVAKRLPPSVITVRIVAGIGNMPAYANELTQEELEAIVAFLVAGLPQEERPPIRLSGEGTP